MAGLLPKETTFGGTEDAGEGELEGGAAAGVGIESEGVDGSSVELERSYRGSSGYCFRRADSNRAQSFLVSLSRVVCHLKALPSRHMEANWAIHLESSILP